MSKNTLPRYRARGRFSREGGEGGGGGTGGQTGGAPAGGAGTEGAGGYTPPATQADLDRIVQDRVRRAEAKYADYDELKTKAARADALTLELGTEADKAAAKAREEAKAEANGHWTPRVVRAEFKAAAKGVLTTEQLDALLEDVDLSKYVTDKGDVDEDKIDKKVKAFAPSGNGGGNGQTRHISLGQGTQPPAAGKKGDAGRAEAARRFGQKTNA
jgi:Spy/CpxP family protein refolding chaperone